MKLIIQIPCWNEAETLPATLAALPRNLAGIDCVERLIVDDGSTDGTSDVAGKLGVEHIVRFPSHRGLAAAFQAGLERALKEGADLILNTDADNQYDAGSIPRLIAPILDGEAEMVIGDRGIRHHPEFSPLKMFLQSLGSRIVSKLSCVEVPDVTSGFRAYTREAAQRLTVLSDYTYTHETVIQAGLNDIKIASVPIQTNRQTRPSRLFRSMWGYLHRSAVTILRIFTLYRPLQVFTLLAAVPFGVALLIGLRFLVDYLGHGSGAGKVQSLILAGVLFNLSFFLGVLGIIADLIGFNRRLLQEILYLNKRSVQDNEPRPRGHTPCDELVS